MELTPPGIDSSPAVRPSDYTTGFAGVSSLQTAGHGKSHHQPPQSVPQFLITPVIIFNNIHILYNIDIICNIIYAFGYISYWLLYIWFYIFVCIYSIYIYIYINSIHVYMCVYIVAYMYI